MTPPDRIDTFSSDFADDTGVWLIITACLFILLGLFAIIEPAVGTLAVTWLVAWLLIIGGATHIISIFHRDDGGVVWHLALGLVYIAGGVYFLSQPLLVGMEALTLLLSMLFFVEAGIDLVAYSAQRREPGAVWLLVNAFVTALLGTLIAMHWPAMTGWVIGTMFGLNLVVTGVSRMMLGIATRTLVST
jgi:uncharacterized membrane protein HdeD (DUF308 family)